MRIPRLLSTTLSAAVLVTATLAVAPGAQATGRSSAHHQLGTTSLAAVLTSDGNTFDRNRYDYDYRYR